MNHELISASQARDVSDAARIRRVLLISARYFGVAPLSQPDQVQGSQP